MEYPFGVYQHLVDNTKAASVSAKSQLTTTGSTPAPTSQQTPVDARVTPATQTTSQATSTTPQGPTQVPANAQKKPKRRRSSVPSRREWEELNFDIYALSAVQARCEQLGRVFPGELKTKLDELTEKAKKQKRTKGKYVEQGLSSVMFFLKNQNLIPVMKKEMQARYTARSAGEDIVLTELSHSDLFAHCKDKSTFIYTGNESDCKDYSFSRKYLQIRSNYTETMGRACLSADWVLNRYRTLKLQMERDSALKSAQQDKANQSAAPDMPNRPYPGYFKGFERPAQPDLPIIKAPVAPQQPTPIPPNPPKQEDLPGFEMPPLKPTPRTDFDMIVKRKRKSKRKFRLPDHTRD